MAGDMVKKVTDVGDAIVKHAGGAVDAVKNIEPIDVLSGAMKVPFVKIDRAKFLRKELIRYYPEEQVNLAIEKNPAYAGIERWSVNKIAKSVISYETKKVSAISVAAGIPGGAAIAATVPADLTQYFGFILRVMQKLAYLYGFDEFEFDEEHISDETMDNILVCMGVMFGVQGANIAITKVADAMAVKVAKDIMKKPLTKGTVYPIIRKIATELGFTMTKQVLADGVSKIVPVLGGVASGGLTYATFRPSCHRLRKEFMTLNISDPEFYKTEKEESIFVETAIVEE